MSRLAVCHPPLPCSRVPTATITISASPRVAASELKARRPEATFSPDHLVEARLMGMGSSPSATRTAGCPSSLRLPTDAQGGQGRLKLTSPTYPKPTTAACTRTPPQRNSRRLLTPAKDRPKFPLKRPAPSAPDFSPIGQIPYAEGTGTRYATNLREESGNSNTQTRRVGALRPVGGGLRGARPPPLVHTLLRSPGALVLSVLEKDLMRTSAAPAMSVRWRSGHRRLRSGYSAAGAITGCSTSSTAASPPVASPMRRSLADARGGAVERRPSCSPAGTRLAGPHRAAALGSLRRR